MEWDCYGWEGTFCHTGTNFFASPDKGLCFKKTDKDYTEGIYPLHLHYGVHHVCTINTLNRRLVEFYNGAEFYSIDMDNSDTYIWDSFYIDSPSQEGLYTFQLQDRDGHVLCEKSCYVGEETANSQPYLPAKDDYTDYAKMQDIVKSSGTLTNLSLKAKYNTLENGLGAINTGLSHQIAGGVTDIKTIVNTVENNANNFTTYFKGLFNLEDGTYGLYLNDIKHSVDNISFPDLSGLSDSVNDLKDSIGNITFPDLSGLSNTLDNVKTSLEDLDIPSLGQISQLTNNVATAVNNIYTHIYQDLVRERNNIFSHIDVKITNLDTDIKNKIDDINIEIPDITFPDLSFITDGLSNVESIINDLDFPTLEGIKTEFENTASTIADKILERILDEIERRYNK